MISIERQLPMMDGASGSFATLALIGVLIAVIAGLVRPEVIRYARQDTFAYEGEPIVWIFAAATLWPCLACVRKAGNSLRFGFLLWFFLGTVTFTKDFSYIRLPGRPVFVTDVLLAALTGSLLIFNPKFRANPRSPAGVFLAAYLAAGAFTFCRSVLAGRPVLLGLRDAAIAWYALFFLIGYLCAADSEKLLLLGKVFFLGAALTSIVAVFYFIHYPQHGYGIHLTPGGIYATAALGVMLIGLENGFVQRGWRSYALTALYGTGVLLSNARTNYAAIGIMLAIAVFAAPKAHRKRVMRAAKPILRAAAVLAIILLALFETPLGSKFVSSDLRIAYQGLFTPERDPDAVWRLAAWAAAIQMFEAHPLVGVGYGEPFHFKFEFDNRSHQIKADTRPHNTYITVLYQMGLIGILPLAAILIHFFRRAFKYLRASLIVDPLCISVTVVQAALIVLGMFNLALETPFYGAIFWLNLGIGFWLIQQRSASESLAGRALARSW